MYLYINTTENDCFSIALFDSKSVVKKKRVQSNKKHSEKLLKSIDAILSSSKLRIKDIKGIAVVCGPGPFTSLRIGVATANALAFGLGVKVACVEKDKELDEIIPVFGKILKSSKKDIVLPEYGADPRIM